MNNDEEAFHQRKPFGEKGVENDADGEKCKHEKRPMPLLGDVGIWMVQDNEALNHGCG
jgi:hypothetical protein